MHVGWRIVLCAGLAALTLAPAAHADLLSRLGGEAVYDTESGITWVANANLAAGSAFDDGSDTTDGLMTGNNALAWADALVFGGVDTWRLPTTPFQDATASIQDLNSYGILVDIGLNASASEMAILYGQLRDAAGSGSPLDHDVIYNIQVVTASPFYWSSSPYGGNPGANFTYSFGGGSTSAHVRYRFNLAAWAVTDGDVFGDTNPPPIPEPSTLLLLGLGLAGVGIWRRKKR